jgi:acetyltransferase-like isoleucine patch superfamily enzyme
MVREIFKRAARGCAHVAVAPWLCSFYLRAAIIGRNRALEGSTQSLAWLPGIWGQYLRRAFLANTIAECAPTATIEFGTILSDIHTRIGEHAYVGPRCHLGRAHIEAGALLAAGVHVPSGGYAHGIADVEQPIRDQQGARSTVRIGAGSWIGSTAVVMADVGANSVVGAGAVVTRPLPSDVIAAGIPARVMRNRRALPAERRA